METTTNTLQILIEKRATEKLEREISALMKSVADSPIITGAENAPVIKVNEGVDSKGNIIWVNRTLSYAFGYSTSIRVALKEQWLKSYIERETKEFLSQVDSLQQQMDQLQDEVSSIDRNH